MPSNMFECVVIVPSLLALALALNEKVAISVAHDCRRVAKITNGFCTGGSSWQSPKESTDVWNVVYPRH